jgi:glycosyltransferase involved in cell wall biosynthesis
MKSPNNPRCRALVITVGQDSEPVRWWWNQLADWNQRDSLEWERISIDNLPQKQLGLRHMPAFITRVFKILRRARRERIDYLITWEADFTCYMIGFLQHLPWFRGPKQVIVQFITRERAANWRSRLRHSIAQMCLSTVHRFICSSRQEVAYYRSIFDWDPQRFRFVLLPADQRLLDMPNPPREDFIIAAGRVYRDFVTLAKAVEGTGIRTIIVRDRRSPKLENLPPEVTVITEMPFDDLMKQVACARVVVVPLTPQLISTGQTFLLQAMSVRAPIVATRTSGTEDYVNDRDNGWLVPPQDVLELRHAIQEVWNDRKLADALGESARATVLRQHQWSHYAAAIAAAVTGPP